MLKQKVPTEAGEIEVREMTFAEVRKVRDEGERLPYTWPVEAQIPASTLDALPHSEVRKLAGVVYDLTYGTAKTEKNS